MQGGVDVGADEQVVPVVTSIRYKSSSSAYKSSHLPSWSQSTALDDSILLLVSLVGIDHSSTIIMFVGS